MKLFNTLGRQVDELHPLEPGHVRMYTCGPTVYNVAHIGNLRTFLFEDVLRRSLKLSGLRVTQIMNLTDVDDKTIRGAAEEGLALGEFTEKYAREFFRDLGTLGIEPAEDYPRATDHVPEMIALIERLRERGHTYESDGSVWFRIATFPDYGKLSRIDLTQTRRGERVADDEYEKEDVKDFALWKGAKPGEPSWASPYGPGRPGWHIECSAMSMKYLGPHFDIHTGAVDNIFPHHENEIAQSEGATGGPFVNLWVHSEHLIVDGEKMSKSKGNFYTLADVLARRDDPAAVRYLFLSVPYRKKLNFTWEGLAGAATAVERIRAAATRFREAAAAAGPKPGSFDAAARSDAFLSSFPRRAGRRPEHPGSARRALPLPAGGQRGARRGRPRRGGRGGGARRTRVRGPRSRRAARPARCPSGGGRGADRSAQRGPQAARFRRGGPDPRRLWPRAESCSKTGRRGRGGNGVDGLRSLTPRAAGAYAPARESLFQPVLVASRTEAVGRFPPCRVDRPGQSETDSEVPPAEEVRGFSF